MKYEMSDFDRYCMDLCKEKMEQERKETEWVADGMEYEDDRFSIYRFQHCSKSKYLYVKVIHTEAEFTIRELWEERR